MVPRDLKIAILGAGTSFVQKYISGEIDAKIDS
jgi:hypothetical protein